jgi:hypothetical protein
MKAGVNIWVLTGDKLETAINIGIFFFSNFILIGNFLIKIFN